MKITKQRTQVDLLKEAILSRHMTSGQDDEIRALHQRSGLFSVKTIQDLKRAEGKSVRLKGFFHRLRKEKRPFVSIGI